MQPPCAAQHSADAECLHNNNNYFTNHNKLDTGRSADTHKPFHHYHISHISLCTHSSLCWLSGGERVRFGAKLSASGRVSR
mmetsp:Transcript_35467/g.95147  ORF Transcript_35467/g.95147 Transcript_35467/m.95147 type:complete len:81 (-) Transcript_35467:87-329(-)